MLKIQPFKETKNKQKKELRAEEDVEEEKQTSEHGLLSVSQLLCGLIWKETNMSRF